MCGLTGFIDGSLTNDDNRLRSLVTGMSDTMIARGPDDSGEWTDAACGVALAFRRLAIVDLSPAGHQPMQSASGRFVMIFNGEVYNYEALRAELIAENAAPPFRGHSDTEVMLACIEAWGLEKAVRRFIGMFAIALWDRAQRTLHLVRDRFGVKPLYYGTAGSVFLFGSELKPLRMHPVFQPEIDRNALALFFRYNYIPAPYSIYRGISKLPPGSILTFTPGKDSSPKISSFWSAREAIEAARSHPFDGSKAEAVDQLDALLRDAIRLRMVADVPLGVFLSGGVDSSTVAALMQAQSSRPIQSFSIGFHDKAYDEAQYAREVARHLGADHTEMCVSPEEAMSVIPQLPTLFDEPFADSSQIPTYLVSRLARQSVTVSLSGDGGDELFGGYNRYMQVRRLWNKIRCLPQPMRAAFAALLGSVPPGTWDGLFRSASPMLPRKARISQPGEKIGKLLNVLDVTSADAMYQRLVSCWNDPCGIVLNASEPPASWAGISDGSELEDITERMMFQDTVTYLPDDILVKVDRASMGVSLEAREPLLDHRLLEFAWQLPLSMKINQQTGKRPLREVLYRYVPAALIERPKAGFAIPLGDWLRGPLREWAEALLQESRIRSEGILDPVPIREKWAAHLSGRQDQHNHLWSVLMFQSWLEASKTLQSAAKG